MLRRRAFVSSMCYVPLDMVGDMDALVRKLTVKARDVRNTDSDKLFVPQVRDAAPEPVEDDPDAPETIEVPLYDLDTHKGMIGIPRHWGLKNLPNIQFEDRTVAGHNTRFAFRSTKPIRPRNPEQAEFFKQLADICKRTGITDYIANAKTGSGKTVGILSSTQQNPVTHLVIVHINRLKKQWEGSHDLKNGMRFLFGDEFVDRWVGFVQQERCDYQGKAIVIGMLPSIARRKYPAAFYNYFGRVTWDEVHKTAAPLLSRALMKFPARVRGGVTATNRKDALRKVTDYHLGPPLIKSAQEVHKPLVYVLQRQKEFDTDHRIYAPNNERAMITILSKMHDRNKWLADLIFERAWKRGRNAIIFSDRTEQLERLKGLLERMGVVPDLCGLYVGCKATRKADIQAHEDELRRVANVCKIILATYGIFDTGGDIARLDWGLEATPRYDVAQPLGRILREYPDKPQPEWYSVVDILKIPVPQDTRTEWLRGEKVTIPFPINAASARASSFAVQDATVYEKVIKA